MKIYNVEYGVVIKSWCDNPEDGAIEQAKLLAKQPYIFKQVCLMPDTHQGMGMPIGGVIATKDVVVPNAVGVDIGCWVGLVKTNIKHNLVKKDDLIKIKDKILELIPMGMKSHDNPQDEIYMPCKESQLEDLEIVKRNYKNALKQVGTLGGGNHFIEIQKGDGGFLYVMLHSGSRNLGLQVANYYNKIAQEVNENYYSKADKTLAFLPIYSDEGKQYLKEMNWALSFAQKNRDLMLLRIKDVLNQVLKCDFDQEINIHHNYAVYENHFGQSVIVHRKGATSAKKDELGLVPGSQGTSSYIVKGLGNRDSYNSCSHGAGRKLSRTLAKNNLDLKYEISLLEKQGIIHSIKSKAQLDEATGAYKNIDVVMEEQKDLVSIVTKLEPLVAIKDTSESDWYDRFKKKSKIKETPDRFKNVNLNNLDINKLGNLDLLD